MNVSLKQEQAARTFVVVLESGDEVIHSIEDFARLNGIQAAHFTAIGAFSQATLAWFSLERKDYDHIPVNEQVEVVSLVGNISMYEGHPQVHAHVAVARRDGAGMGGHILEAYVRPTLEIFVTELPGRLERKKDPETTLPLLHIDEPHEI
jgi:predicted DNA-binding protein with PD1-like motif